MSRPHIVIQPLRCLVQSWREAKRRSHLFLLLTVGALSCAPAQADPLFDFATFDMPRAEQLRMRQPRVSWRISAQPQKVCADIQPQDGHSSWQGNCATWHFASKQCTVVTTGNTTHSVLGHLFLACLTGH